MPSNANEWAQTLSAIIIAAGVLYNIWLGRQTRKEVHTVEQATNHLTDALVASTATASSAEGKLAGIQHEQERMGTASTAIVVDTASIAGSVDVPGPGPESQPAKVFVVPPK